VCELTATNSIMVGLNNSGSSRFDTKIGKRLLDLENGSAAGLNAGPTHRGRRGKGPKYCNLGLTRPLLLAGSPR
jgi:hypothetical protein